MNVIRTAGAGHSIGGSLACELSHGREPRASRTPLIERWAAQRKAVIIIEATKGEIRVPEVARRETFTQNEPLVR